MNEAEPPKRVAVAVASATSPRDRSRRTRAGSAERQRVVSAEESTARSVRRRDDRRRQHGSRNTRSAFAGCHPRAGREFARLVRPRRDHSPTDGVQSGPRHQWWSPTPHGPRPFRLGHTAAGRQRYAARPRRSDQIGASTSKRQESTSGPWIGQEHRQARATSS